MTSLAKLTGESLNAASHAAHMGGESVRNHQDIHNTPSYSARNAITLRVGERIGNRVGEKAADYGKERMGARMQSHHQSQGSNNARR